MYTKLETPANRVYLFNPLHVSPYVPCMFFDAFMQQLHWPSRATEVMLDLRNLWEL